jgi:hypothetical protein
MKQEECSGLWFVQSVLWIATGFLLIGIGGLLKILGAIIITAFAVKSWML